MSSTQRTCILVVLVFLTAAGISLAQNQPVVDQVQPDRLDQAERLRLADAIMAEKERLSERSFDVAWKMNKVRDLATQSRDVLEAMLSDVESGVAVDLTKALGDSGADLVFTPLQLPCRFYDSRFDVVPGPIFPGSPFSFIVAGPIPGGPTGQGASSDCGIPFGPAVAIVANVLAVDTGGKGNFQVWPFGGTAGDAVINFASKAALDINLINGVMIPICNPNTSFCPADLTARLNFAGFSDFVVNVTGYFSAPEATPLSCQTISDSRTVPSGSTWNFTSGNCPAGYTMTGGGHNYTVNISGPNLWQVGPEGNAFRCRGLNSGPNTEMIHCYARCCRVPGI
jgi:hypothetical protein